MQPQGGVLTGAMQDGSMYGSADPVACTRRLERVQSPVRRQGLASGYLVHFASRSQTVPHGLTATACRPYMSCKTRIASACLQLLVEEFEGAIYKHCIIVSGKCGNGCRRRG